MSEITDLRAAAKPSKASRPGAMGRRFPNGDFINALEASAHLSDLRSLVGIPEPEATGAIRLDIVALNAEIKILEAFAGGVEEARAGLALAKAETAKPPVQSVSVAPPVVLRATPPAAEKVALTGRARFAAGFKVAGSGIGVYVGPAAKTLASRSAVEALTGRHRFAQSLKIVGALVPVAAAAPAAEISDPGDAGAPIKPLSGRQRFALGCLVEGQAKK